jgi:zinc-binding alcohol dehydrogenase family protein
MGGMKAVGSFAGLAVDDPDSLQDIVVDVPQLRPRDVLVRVLAVSVNPVDIKRRRALAPSETPTILGHDAAGIVEAVGPEVTTLSVGDEVWYAGDVTRPGTNAEFHAVDERIVSRKPSTLSFSEAAAMPLTTITAWETLFERFRLNSDSPGTLVVLGAAGGVGSIMVQLAKVLTAVRVVATASRPESVDWVRQLGADAVVDHNDLQEQVSRIAPGGVDYLFTPHSAGGVETFAAIMRPFGHITAIDEPDGLDLLPLKAKSIAWHWELMFTRSLFDHDMIGQQRLLARTADLVDRGLIATTVTKTISGLDAKGIREAHRDVESGRTIGKVVVCRQ